MSLDPSVTITPLTPYGVGYDGAFWTVQSWFTSYGGVTYTGHPWRLQDNCELDRIGIRADDNLDNTLHSGTVYHRHSCFYLSVRANDAYWESDSQVLIVFDVESASGTQDIQIFVGSDLVREETIDGRENIAILYDFVPVAAVVLRPKDIYEKLRFYKANVFVI
ncbi:MAG: hypothetical protein ACFFFC_13050 [Candidatus Thorarchaeota archaeon]